VRRPLRRTTSLPSTWRASLWGACQNLWLRLFLPALAGGGTFLCTFAALCLFILYLLNDKRRHAGGLPLSTLPPARLRPLFCATLPSCRGGTGGCVHIVLFHLPPSLPAGAAWARSDVRRIANGAADSSRYRVLARQRVAYPGMGALPACALTLLHTYLPLPCLCARAGHFSLLCAEGRGAARRRDIPSLLPVPWTGGLLISWFCLLAFYSPSLAIPSMCDLPF